MESDFLTNAVLVVAHPDDEVLWFSGVLSRVDRVIVCFGPNPFIESLGLARQRVRARYPLNNVTWLELEEPNSLLAADWRNPVPNAYGLELLITSGARRRYRRAFERVSEALSRELRSYHNVVTHNPWGEYGHEDHVLVHRAVVKAVRDDGKVWCTNYCSSRSAALAAQHTRALGSAPRVTVQTDNRLAETIKRIYVEEACWTWPSAYAWPSSEVYVELSRPQAEAAQTKPLPLNSLAGQPFESHMAAAARVRALAKSCLPRGVFTAIAPIVRRLRGRPVPPAASG